MKTNAGKMTQQARLVRAVGEVLSRGGDFADLWEECALPLRALADAGHVSIRLFDQIGSAAHGPLRSAYRDGELLTFPLLSKDRTIGAIVFEDLQPPDPATFLLLESCAFAIAARVDHEASEHVAERFAHLAFVDALTGIANRRRFDETLRTEWARAARERTWLAMIVADIDFFKAYNDGYGHQAGDMCLHEVASILNGCVQRPTDLLARYGGEEFVALLPNTDLAGAVALGQRFRAVLAERAFTHGGSSLGCVSLSAGVAAMIPTVDGLSATLVRAADAALYEAKLAGRDRVWAPGFVEEREPIYARRPSVPNNVVLPELRLVGRVAEVAETLALLHDRRFVTIVGEPGIGKTRVAVHVALEAMVRHGDGVWFVDFAPIDDPLLIVPTIGAALGVAAGDDDLDAIVRVIGTKSVLLVLDGCERAAAAIRSAMAGLLDACPELRVLATARVPIGIDDEAIYRLLPFRLPDSRSRPSAVEAAGFDAVALFVERARENQPGFALLDVNAPIISSICRHAGGIALAIELAAARSGTEGLEALERALARIVGPQSHDPLRAVLRLCYDFLLGPQQVVLRRLAVFAGSWTLADAETVCGEGTESDSSFGDAHRALVDAALIVDLRESGRFRLLPTIRTFAERLLGDSGELHAVSGRHATALVRTVAAMDTAFGREPNANEVPYEIADIRKALAWCFGPDGNPEHGAEIIAALAGYFSTVRQSEALRWTRRAAFSLPESASHRLRARVLMRVANAAGALAPEALDAAERAVALFDAAGDAIATVDALCILARVIGFYRPSERERASLVAADALTRARGLGEPIAVLQALATYGGLLDPQRLIEKQAAFEEALGIARHAGDERLLCEVSMWSAESAFAIDAFTDAIAYGTQALGYAEECAATDLVIVGATNLAFYACAAGDLDYAGRVGRRALALARDADAGPRLTFAVQALASIAAEQGDDARAARLLGFSDARAGVVHMPRQFGQTEDIMFNRTFDALRDRMGLESFSRAFAQGAMLDVERAERDAMR